MDDVVDRIEQQIRIDRRTLGRDIQALEDRAHEAMDWRRHYSDHAGTVMAVAFGSGLLLGAMSRGGTRATVALPRSVLGVVDPSGRATNQVGELVGDIINAGVGMAGAAAVEVISEWIPGFKQQFDSRRRRL